MPKLIKKLLSLLIIIALSASFIPTGTIHASIDNCTANISPNQVGKGTTNNFTLTVDNTSSNDIVWIRIIRPSPNFTLSNINASGWTKSLSPSVITLSNGSLSSGSQRNFILTNVVAANVDAASANWTVQTSDDSVGASPTTCSGTLGTQIGTADTTPPVISNIQVSNITSSSATISWTTDEPSDSKVDYGTTASYGSSANSATLTINHSTDLTALNSNSGYHYKVSSSDASSNSAFSGDNTFLTLTAPVTPPSQTPTITNNQLSQPNSTTKKPSSKSSDKTAPTVAFKTLFQNVFKDPPLIEGSVSDDVAVSKIEISTDNGLNWLTLSDTTGIETKQANFSYKSPNLPDGNYLAAVRAFDSSGNLGISSTETLIIDKISPVIGPAIVSVGPQIVTPDENTIHAVPNVDQKVTLSTIGGPTSIVINATSSDKKIRKSFTLSRIGFSDLWSGILAFDKIGEYRLEATAIDGAKNKTSRTLNQITVDQASKVVSKNSGAALKSASLTLNYFDQDTSSWVIWDGLAYGEKNPQTVNQIGEFSFYIPEGKYYLKAAANGFQDFTSEIFLIKKNTNLSVEVDMEKQTSFKIGSFVISIPSFSLTSSKLKFNKEVKNSAGENSLVGKDLPNFEFSATNDQKVKSIDLLGKDTLVTFLSTWDPNVEDQISQLESLEAESKYNLIRLNPLESLSKLKSYKKIAGYKGDFLADEKGESLGSFQVTGLPIHLFVSKSGNVKKVLVGVLTVQELIYNLNN